MDSQLGRVLDALKASGKAHNTIIVLWGDHGYHLGDHGMWCKHTNYEQSTRSPLLIINPLDPQLTPGSKSNVPVELIDLYATLADLSGLPKPQNIDSSSLTPILHKPKKPTKPYALSQFPRFYEADNEESGHEIMGYAWRTDRYRYIEWIDTRFRQGGKLTPQSKIIDIELYDYQTDPKETRNLASDPTYAAVLVSMQKLAIQYKQTVKTQ